MKVLKEAVLDQLQLQYSSYVTISKCNNSHSKYSRFIVALKDIADWNFNVLHEYEIERIESVSQ